MTSNLYNNVWFKYVSLLMMAISTFLQPISMVSASGYTSNADTLDNTDELVRTSNSSNTCDTIEYAFSNDYIQNGQDIEFNLRTIEENIPRMKDNDSVRYVDGKLRGYILTVDTPNGIILNGAKSIETDKFTRHTLTILEEEQTEDFLNFEIVDLEAYKKTAPNLDKIPFNFEVRHTHKNSIVHKFKKDFIPYSMYDKIKIKDNYILTSKGDKIKSESMTDLSQEGNVFVTETFKVPSTEFNVATALSIHLEKNSSIEFMNEQTRNVDLKIDSKNVDKFGNFKFSEIYSYLDPNSLYTVKYTEEIPKIDGHLFQRKVNYEKMYKTSTNITHNQYYIPFNFTNLVDINVYNNSYSPQIDFENLMEFENKPFNWKNIEKYDENYTIKYTGKLKDIKWGSIETEFRIPKEISDEIKFNTSRIKEDSQNKYYTYLTDVLKNKSIYISFTDDVLNDPTILNKYIVEKDGKKYIKIDYKHYYKHTDKSEIIQESELLSLYLELPEKIKSTTTYGTYTKSGTDFNWTLNEKFKTDIIGYQTLELVDKIEFKNDPMMKTEIDLSMLSIHGDDKLKIDIVSNNMNIEGIQGLNKNSLDSGKFYTISELKSKGTVKDGKFVFNTFSSNVNLEPFSKFTVSVKYQPKENNKGNGTEIYSGSAIFNIKKNENIQNATFPKNYGTTPVQLYVPDNITKEEISDLTFNIFGNSFLVEDYKIGSYGIINIYLPNLKSQTNRNIRYKQLHKTYLTSFSLKYKGETYVAPLSNRDENNVYYLDLDNNIYLGDMKNLFYDFTKQIKDDSGQDKDNKKWTKVTTCDDLGICKDIDKEFINSIGKSTLYKVEKSKFKYSQNKLQNEDSLTTDMLEVVTKEEMKNITRKDLMKYTYFTERKVFDNGYFLNYSAMDLNSQTFSEYITFKDTTNLNNTISYQSIPEEYFFECGDFPIKSSEYYCSSSSLIILNKSNEPYDYTYVDSYKGKNKQILEGNDIKEREHKVPYKEATFGMTSIDIKYKDKTETYDKSYCDETITICEEKTIKTELNDVTIEFLNPQGKVIKQDTIKNGEYKFNVFDEDLKELYRVKLSKPNYQAIEVKLTSFLNNCEIDGNLVPETCNNFTITSNVNEAKVLVENTKTSEKYEGTIKDGKFVVNKNLSKVDTFKITVSKEGYVTETIETTLEDCKVDLQLTKNICDTFTVKTNVKDGSVELENKTTKEVIKGKIVDNKFVTDTPLKKGETYKLSVSSYGHKDITKEIVIDECEIELTLEKDVCEAFTVNVGKDDVKVTIKLGSKVVSEGLTKDGKYVATEPLDKVELYTITLEKDGYHTKTETTTLSECEIKLDIVEKPIVKPQICENLVINVGVDGATVKVEDYKNDVVFEGISVNGKVQLDEALPKNIPFKVTVTKGTSSTVVFETIGTDDDCELTIEFKYIEYCTEFTITTNVDNTTVKIVDSNNKTVFDSVVNGKSIKLNNQLEQGKKYKVTVTKEGYKTFTKEITVDNLCAFNVTLEKEEPIKNVCTEFTVKSNVDGAKVTISDKNTKFKVTGTITKGEFISNEPLEEGKEYEVLIEKEGYESIDTVFTVTKECEITLEMTKIVPKVCDNFTVNVNIDGAKVVVKDNKGKVIEEGNTKDKKHIITKPLTKGETYTIEVTKEGYKKAVKVVTVEDCMETINLEKEEPVINYCETFKVTTNVDGATVTISELNGNAVVKGNSTNKEFISAKPLEQGKEYLIKVEKDGYETTEKVVKISDCEIEINLIKSTPIEPTVCDTFTIKVNQDGATVVIKDSKGNEVSKGISKDGKFISTKPLDLKKEYSFKVTKDGYETVSFKKVITECEETINLVKVEPKVCDNYLIKLNVDGANIVIKDSKGNEVSKGISKDGKYNVTKPLEIGKTYSIKVTKDGYKEVSYDKVITDCEETITLVKDEPKLEICDSFTVNVNVDGATVVIKNALDEELVKGTSKDGKFTTNYALEKGNGYIIEVTKKGYKTVKYNFNIYDCEETVTLEKEEPKLEVCENFTVNVNVDGAKVVIKNVLDEEIVKGTSKDGKFVTNYPLEIGNGYIVEVTKEGYKTVKYNFNIYDCSETITLEKEETPVPNVCNSFEVKVNVDGATVIITDSKGNVVDKGISKDNKFITTKPLNKDEVYTVKLSKDGYYEKTVTTTKDSCELEVVMDTVKPNVCTNTVIKVNKSNNQPLTNVSIEVREVNGDSVTNGKVDKNGEFLVDKPLDFGKDYEFVIKKSGYKTQRITRTLDECLSLDVVLKRVSSGGGGGSYEPEEKPSKPEEKPTKPEEKPTVPEEKPTEPEEKPTEPEEKPSKPEEKPTVPEEKPIVPEEKPVKPIEPIKPIIPTQPIKPLEPIRPTVPTENNLNSNVVPNYVAPTVPTQTNNSEQVNTNNSLNNKPLPQTNTENTSMLFITYGLLLLAIGTVIRRKEQEEK